MDASTAQNVAAVGSVIGAAGGITAATFGALTWWRGRTRARPDLVFDSDEGSWGGFDGPNPEPDVYGTVHNTLHACTLTNVGDAPAYAVRLEIAGAGAYAHYAKVSNPIPLLGEGASMEFALVIDQPVEEVRIALTWGQPPKASKRRGPRTWNLVQFAPSDWSPKKGPEAVGPPA